MALYFYESSDAAREAVYRFKREAAEYPEHVWKPVIS